MAAKEDKIVKGPNGDTELDEDELDDTEDTDDEENEEEISDFDAWLAKQPKSVQKAYEAKTTGLSSALKTERAQRKALSKQVGKLAKQEGTSEEQATKLKELQAQLDEQNLRATFFENAGDTKTIGMRVTNPKLAFIALKAADLIDNDGDVDWETAKVDYPELFAPLVTEQKQERKKAPKGNAGDGTDGDGVKKPFNMNEWIRGGGR